MVISLCIVEETHTGRVPRTPHRKGLCDPELYVLYKNVTVCYVI